MDSQASRRIAYTLTQSIPPDPNSVAANMPLDIFVDNISPYLQVEDIMALRRVNKHYFHLTHEPLIWKRFIQQLRIPLPPMRPTLDYSSQRTDYEFEELVSRSISMEDNWRKRRPAVASTIAIDASLEVFDMKLLPGGKYLVASVGDDHCFFITVYHLDHPAVSLVKYQIPTKAYQLQAKYMKYGERFVIMIAYISRAYKGDGPENIDPVQFASNATVDPPAPNPHILSCIHVDLSTLDLLARALRDPTHLKTIMPKLRSPGYQILMQTVRMPLKTPALQLSLYSRAGVPHVSVVQDAIEADGQDYLVIINLEHQTQDVLVFRPFVYPHVPNRPVNPLPAMKQWVKAVRHLPEQNHVLIWRTIKIAEADADESYVHALELVRMPADTHEKNRAFFSTPICGSLLLQGNIQSVHMTDDLLPYDGESNVPLRTSSQPPLPISVFAEMTGPQRIFHLHIWPTPGPTPQHPPYIYHPHPDTVAQQVIYNPHPYTGHILPGVFRSLFYTTQKTDRADAPPSLVSLHRYISPEFQDSRYPLAFIEFYATADRHNYLGLPSSLSAAINIGEEAAARYREYGVGAIAWDQSMGRLCMTIGRGSVIQVMDFSHATPPDERFLQWKMTHPGGFERMEDDQENEFVLWRCGSGQ